MAKRNRGFADREKTLRGHTGDSAGLTGEQIHQRIARGQVRRLTAAQLEYAVRQRWIK